MVADYFRGANSVLKTISHCAAYLQWTSDLLHGSIAYTLFTHKYLNQLLISFVAKQLESNLIASAFIHSLTNWLRLKAHSHCKLDWMHVQTGLCQRTIKSIQFTFVHSPYCKLTSVKSYSSHDHCASVVQPLEFKFNNASENFNSFEDCSISCHSIEFILDICMAPYAHKSPVFLVRPASHVSVIFVCTCERWSIYRCTNNVYMYIVWLQVWIHFELDQNHLLEWIGSKSVWIQFGPIHFWCERDECTLNWIECALSVNGP